MRMPEAEGRAVELRLHGYRRNFHHGYPIAGDESGGWGPADLEALRWIAELGESGHWGAKALLRRIAEDSRARSKIDESVPEAKDLLARFSPRLALGNAAAEVQGPAPDWARVRLWVMLADCRALAEALDEVRRIIGTLDDRDRALVAGAIDRGRQVLRLESHGITRSDGIAELFADLGLARTASGLPETASVGRALLGAAAQRGERRALDALLQDEWPKAADKGAFAHEWCSRYPYRMPAAEVDAALELASPLAAHELEAVKEALENGVAHPGTLLLELARRRHAAGGDPLVCAALIERALRIAGRPEYEGLWREVWNAASDRCAALAAWLERFPDFAFDKKQAVRVGAWIERGNEDSEKGLHLASVWYARAKGIELPADGSIPCELCYFVATYVNPHSRFSCVNEPELARSWLERGIRLGNDFCLDDWLRAAVVGQLGIPRDPDAALAQVRLLASALSHSGSRPLTGFSSGFAAVCKLAEAYQSGKATGVPKDDALARRWLLVAAEARIPEGLRMLAAFDAAPRT
jgi:TPR repeat protein